MVTPEDAERIALAASQGQVMLSLRNPMDTATVETTGQATASLLGEPGPQPVPPPAPPPAPRRTIRPAPAPQVETRLAVLQPYTVESIKAAKRTTEQVKDVLR
jgi:pilus assembly protein CpaB